ncbi:MAG TPA: TRAP transporter small permease [Candidatus Limnocylindria bacterium]|nr:TRAP transporter small permease [Candidatus Limnocylindria bacterium]
MDRAMGPVCRTLTWAGAGCLAGMGLLTAADVAGRYFLNRPVEGAVELSEFALVLLVFLGLGSTGLTGNQVVVDIVVERFGPRLRAGSDAVNALLGIGFWTLVAWRTMVQGREVALRGEVSTILAIPTYPFVYAVALGCGIMALALVGRLLAALSHTGRR